MSRTIDERVVEMRFDNKQFEAGTKQTMGTLQKLKKSLDFSKVGESFKNIDAAANKVDMAGLGQTISGIHEKFSALEVVAITTLGNITNSIVNSAKNWVSAFTIDPIKSGFQEYETQINAVQTILANTQKEGTNIKDVNAALDELNLYADKTIYNFTEMTRNIGTFTAAGVDLKTSVNAIQGIANLAAVSGSNSQQASTAMYQLSQALATGTVKLMDWNSVVNAGMGGQLFQDALKETSRLLGTGADAAIKAEGSFRESLKQGWLTSEVLTQTLKKFTTSGAAEYVAKYTGLSKEAVESEIELAKSMYGEAEAIDKAAESLAKKSGKNKAEIAQTLNFAQTAEDAATKVKTFTQLIDTLKEAVQSGWSQSFRIIVGDFEEAKKLFTEISDSFGAVIGSFSDARNKLLVEVFNKQDAQDYMAAVVDVPKESISELQTVAKEAGTSSDLFKKTLKVFTKGDKTLNEVMTHMIEMVNSEKDVDLYISKITKSGIVHVKELQNIGKTYGYTSEQFKSMTKTLAKGNPEMEATITHLLKMSDAMQKPSGRELLIDSLRNGMKGLVSVIKPVHEAFREVFPPATADQVYGMLESFREFTKMLILSEKDSQNLKKAFKGLFDVAGLLGDGFISLVKLIIPIEKPISALGGGVLGLAGALGSLLSTISNGIRSSKLLRVSFNLLQVASSGLMSGLSGLIKTGITFVERLSKMEGTVKLINSVTNAFEKLYLKASPYIDDFILEAEALFASLFHFEDISIDDALKAVSDAFVDLAWEIDHFSFQKMLDSFENFKNQIEDFLKIDIKNEGLKAFIENIKEYGKELEEAFSWENVLKKIDWIRDKLSIFIEWIKTTVGPVLKDFSIGGTIAAAGGMGVIYSFLKIAKVFEKIVSAFDKAPKLIDSLSGALGAVKGALNAYQKDLKAEALLKIAGAIAILAGALVLLSFADPKRLLAASFALTVVAGVLGFAITKFLGALNKGKELNSALTMFSKGLSSTMKKFGKAMQIKAIGETVKKFAESVGIIALSIIGLGIMWKKDPEAFKAATNAVAGISGIILLIAALSFLATKAMKKKDAKAMEAIGKTILMTSASLSLIVASIAKLMKMELPTDYGVKLGILGGIIGGLAVLALALAGAAKIAGKNQLPKMSSTIKSLAVLLLATVISLKALFKMELPTDYQVKLGILGGIFVGFAALILAMGFAARISKGQGFKAAATILSMAAFLVVVVGSLFVLSIIPADKMLKGALALGGILLALGVALAGAGQTDKNAYKNVLAMTIAIGIITAALAVLAIIPFDKLLKSTFALGASLLALAATFSSLSKVKSKNALPAILGMITATIIIAYSLYALSEQPWDGILAATVGLSGTLLALAGCFAIISKAKVNLTAIGALIAGSAALLIVVGGIAILAKYEPSALLASCLAIGSMLLIMTGVMAICAALSSVAVGAMTGVLALGAIIVELGAVIAAIGALAQIPGLKWLIGEGGDMLQLIGTAIGQFIGGIVGGVMSGISSQLPQIGIDLSAFMTNLIPFMVLSKMIDDESVASVGRLAAVIVALTAAEVVNGIASLFGLSLVDVAIELSNFMIALTPFMISSKMLDEESMRACGYLADMIIKLTAADIINGIGQFLGLSGNLSDFGAQLSDFGPAIADFANVVKDVKPEAVQGAAAAAEIMANVAGKLQGHGGIIQWIVGEKSLGAFARELRSFGPSIKDFADDVKDVKPEAVQGAAAAAEIMANMADKLPNQGGLAAKIFGDNTLSEFGAELVAFGPDIVEFANTVADINGAAVAGAAAATSIMSTIATNLPDSETLWNKIFGGGQVSISEFGEELVAFGNSMSDLSGALAEADIDQINGAVSSFKTLVDLATAIQGASADGLSSFADNLGNIGSDSVTKFIQAFSGADEEAKAGINNLLNAMITSIKAKNPTFDIEGANTATYYLKGIARKYPDALQTGINLAIQVLNGLIRKLNEFTTRGEESATYYLKGFTNKTPEAKQAAADFAAIITKAMGGVSEDIYLAGSNAGDGFIAGLKSKISEAASIGAAIGKAASDATANALDEHSPSKVMKEHGDFAGLGFIIGLTPYIQKAYDMGEELGEEVYGGLNSSISLINDVSNPVITPTVDLSNVRSSARDIGRMFNDYVQDVSIRASSIGRMVSSDQNPSRNVQGNVGAKTSPVYYNNYNYEQNNYSPKTLSAVDIYRQTKNQISMFKNQNEKGVYIK